jgi:hypothetical protein
MLVKIDRQTIKKNPRAGARETNFPGRTTISVIAKGNEAVPESVIPEEVRFASIDNTGRSEFLADSMQVARDFEVDLSRLGFQVKINASREIVKSYHDSIPRYSYSFAPKDVKCKGCGSEFDHTQLGELLHEEGDDYVYVELVCPRCGIEDCCDLEYERFDDSMVMSNEQPLTELFPGFVIIDDMSTINYGAGSTEEKAWAVADSCTDWRAGLKCQAATFRKEPDTLGDTDDIAANWVR